MYQYYLFDLYGTLVDIQTNEKDRAVWEKLSIYYGYYSAHYTPEELQQCYLLEEQHLRKQALDNSASKENVYPEIVLEYVFQTLFAKKGAEVPLEIAKQAGQLFRISSLQYIALYPNIPEMLVTLKEKQKKIYLLSNAQQIFTEYEMNYLDIRKYFDGILFSSDAGYMKPDIRFYQKAIEQFGIQANEAIMIGNDYVCDIQGAKAAGLDAFYVHTDISPAMPENLPEGTWMHNMDGNALLDRIPLK
ncbi:HAD family hydrolase [[Clostridium] polysaccharolyticum]|uniref:Putative hydrolase of the HAD superfamily n=1 Tax=[Clostridium] polysaccharolyticum TaxID=29364 RepID=A0A1I0ED10_9FIRM|nr:HAD family hydrolase [[Clostridium] polysaccharolyticum]SET43141.1 putative hydrolase of the HAD superfamily [[Clostridium] polysaccharolyticum]